MQPCESSSIAGDTAGTPANPVRDKWDWAGKPSTEPAEVMRQYDEFAPSYDETLLWKWGYQAPAMAAELLAKHVPLKSIILDAGCGTGLTGSELRRVGFDTVEGADISATSLQLAAAKGVYRAVICTDLLQPLPFDTGSFDAAMCVGVLSYITGDGLFRELCRVTRSGGAIVLSHRSDLIVSRSFVHLIQRLEAEGLWSLVHQSGDLPYLPEHPDFADRIPIRLFVLRVG
jgi:predicted TPR repeat methyltransferase